MTKKEIVKSISDELGLTQLRTKEIVQKTFDAIVETLVEERRIELRNFGVFEVKMRAARKARNPRTGGQVEVPAKFVVTLGTMWVLRGVAFVASRAESILVPTALTAVTKAPSLSFSTFRMRSQFS